MELKIYKQTLIKSSLYWRRKKGAQNKEPLITANLSNVVVVLSWLPVELTFVDDFTADWSDSMNADVYIFIIERICRICQLTMSLRCVCWVTFKTFMHPVLKGLCPLRSLILCLFLMTGTSTSVATTECLSTSSLRSCLTSRCAPSPLSSLAVLSILWSVRHL